MGWLTFHETRSAKQYFIDEYAKETRCELLDIAVVGFRTAFLAVRDLEKGYTFCAVYLLHRAPKDYYNFGYKDMSEFAGPCQDNCPKRIIDLLTPLDEIKKLDPEIGENSIEWASDWRKRCIDNAVTNKERNKALKNSILKTKEPLQFRSGAEFQYFTKEGRQLYALKDFGTKYEMKIPVRIGGWKHIEYEVVKR